ncbi:hypothetical protein GNT69_23085 [Bacillus sp. B15-48]|nr:hypothetical protein [Bacillus sp. B15-48]
MICGLETSFPLLLTSFSSLTIITWRLDDNEVCTGSFNFTVRAMNRNWENIICSNNRDMLNSFINEFLQMWNTANHLQDELNIEHSHG